MRGISCALAAGLLLVGLVAAPVAAAGRPTDVALVAVHPELDTGTFTARGDGLCPSGTVDVVAGMIAGWRSGTIANFLVIQQFACDDGSGSFLVRIQARAFANAPSDFGTWQVIGGDGDYAQLQGTGSLIGIYDGVGGITDYLAGQVH